MRNDRLSNMIEVSLYSDEDFLKIKETLTRIGVTSRDNSKLYQSCHILKKQSKYYIVHFKEMFLLDGKHSSLNKEDIERRNTISNLLEKWELLEIKNKEMSDFPKIRMYNIKIIPFHEKGNWELCTKYSIGKKKNGY